MKVIIAGSRNISWYPLVESIIKKSGFKITEVVSGAARGVDTQGEIWAQSNNIPTKVFKVTSDDWKTIGKSAGFRRNGKMAAYADGLIAIWDGESNGTRNMIEQMQKLHKPVHVVKVDLDEMYVPHGYKRHGVDEDESVT